MHIRNTREGIKGPVERAMRRGLRKSYGRDVHVPVHAQHQRAWNGRE